jgi:pyruvate/2-oxoglutarate dehydrogenase complex dihydrolipoamide dehydrogenase (E3) component
MAKSTINVDLCVIGAGAAGLSVAAAASQLGATVVLIENTLMGGECLNTGCVPSKALLAAKTGTSFADAYDRMQAVIDEIAPHDSQERFEGMGVNVLRETARFTGPRSLAAGENEIHARRFVVATGSKPAIPAGLGGVPYFTNETLFDSRPEPTHLVILGGGPMGVEMAQAYRQLGAAVTLVVRSSILSSDDSELVALLRVKLLSEGIKLVEQASFEQAEQTSSGVAIICRQDGQEHRLEGSHLLVAAGRVPHIDGLDLERANVQMTDGKISTDSAMRTSNKRIYAIGDVVGPDRFTHMAGFQARLVLRSALFRLPVFGRAKAIPRVTYTKPEVAQVGLTEREARVQAGDQIRIARFPFGENDRAVIENAADGMIKVVATAKGRVLGVSIVGAGAGELLLPWTLAIDRRLKLSALAGTIVAYPTMSEVSARVAGSFYLQKFLNERTRRVVRLLARLG